MNEIIEILKTHTAFSFAESKLNNIKKQEYYTSIMRDSYSGKDNPSIEECEENAVRSFIDDYIKMCEIYSGFIENGKLFILDKRDKFVLALYSNDGKSNKSITHYNPINVNCIEQSIPTSNFFLELGNRYEISKDEESLIKECDILIN